MNRKAAFLAASALCAGAVDARAQGIPTVGLGGAPTGSDAQGVVLNCLIKTATGTFAVPCGGDSTHPLYVTGGSGGGGSGSAGTVTQGPGSTASPWSVQGTLGASQAGTWHMSIDNGTLTGLPPITGSVAVSGGTITAGGGTLSASQAGTWHVSIDSGTLTALPSVTGSVTVSGGTLSASVLNWPATQAVQDSAAIASLGTIATNTAPQSGNRTFASCTVGTVSTQCLAAMPGRRGLIVENHSGEAGAPSATPVGVTCTESVAATAFLGWVLAGNGGAFELELPNVIPAGAINCISNGSSAVTITLGQV